jgi:hypothetical protein
VGGAQLVQKGEGRTRGCKCGSRWGVRGGCLNPESGRGAGEASGDSSRRRTRDEGSKGRDGPNIVLTKQVDAVVVGDGGVVVAWEEGVGEQEVEYEVGIKKGPVP